ncbi:MAG TPA: CehA/McbA family metallohydrolase [Polyangia bacterium]|jgi:hypothetical protein|nr:CehA/McbA family metallohydrolase [Polyangia bacterium]
MRLRSFVPLLAVTTLAVATLLYSHLAAAPPPLPPSPLLPRLSPEAGLSFSIRDADTGELMPGKLTFLGAGGSRTPEFSRNDIGRTEEGGVAAFNHVFSAGGLGVVRVPLGTYDVYVSRGPEWDLFVARNVRVGPQGAELRATLRRAFDTTGWLSGDFHVHSAASMDSHVPLLHRVHQFLADGVEMIVATDHNVVSDYAPIIAELGVGRYLACATGDELTTATWGHFGAFPLPQVLESAGQGAVLVHGRTARDFFADVRKAAPAALIDVHHPRIDNLIGYFDLGRFDSHADRAERPGFSYDFDAIEVLNGYQDSERRSIDRVMTDWFALLDHGHLVTATGNSDTHHLTYNLGGYPRNYVLLRDDHPAVVRPEEVAAAVRAHHSFFTTGPFVQLTVNQGRIGDTVPAPGGTAYAEVDVRAASWVDISEVTLFVDGKEERRWELPRGTHLGHFHEGHEFALKRDAYVVARVEGREPLAPVIGDRERFVVLPFALTNPVFLDVDGNGHFDAALAHGSHVAPAPAAAPPPAAP